VSGIAGAITPLGTGPSGVASSRKEYKRKKEADAKFAGGSFVIDPMSYYDDAILWSKGKK
tara:strand:+ start:4375 stop:4554 length:180 start_codon:yes stop_codon:yes gene_type:complete